MNNFNLSNFLFNAEENAQLSLLTYLRLTQFSYTKIGSFLDDLMSFEQDTQFSHTEIGNFPDNFMFLNE